MILRDIAGKSLSVQLYGPSHYMWKHTPSKWYYRPDKDSTGGVGFKVILLPKRLAFHLCFMWTDIRSETK